MTENYTDINMINLSFCKENGIEITDELREEIKVAIRSNIREALLFPHLRYVLWLDENGKLHTLIDLAGGDDMPIMVWEGRGVVLDEQCMNGFDFLEECYETDADIIMERFREFADNKARFDELAMEQMALFSLSNVFPSAYEELREDFVDLYAADYIVKCDEDLYIQIDYYP